MSKGFKGFLIGLFVLVIAFVVTVLIMASIHGVSFVEEIQSWFKFAEELPEETVKQGTETFVNLLKM